MQRNLIALITHEYPPTRGGAGVYCEELAHASMQSDINVEVLAPSNALTENSIKVRRMSHKGSQSWICSWKLIRHVKKNLSQYKYLHLADPGVLRAMIRFGWLLKEKPPFLVTIHGSELLRFTKNVWEKFLFQKLLSEAKKIHVLSLHNEKNLKTLCPKLEKRILRIPGAPARRVIPEKENSNGKENSANFSRLVLLCVGRVHPRKGQLELIQAIGELNSRSQKKLVCRMVGPTVHHSYYKKLKRAAALLDCPVEFLGDQEDEELKISYANADIFALTSIHHPKSIEGFGFVYLEASAHGLPIVAHRTGGVEDAVKDKVTGFLTDPNNPSELTDKIDSLINDYELRKIMGKKGKEWADRHSWTNIAQKLYANL